VRRADTIGAFTAYHEGTKGPTFTKLLRSKNFVLFVSSILRDKPWCTRYRIAAGDEIRAA